jgi:hypothetical protein
MGFAFLILAGVNGGGLNRLMKNASPSREKGKVKR